MIAGSFMKILIALIALFVRVQNLRSGKYYVVETQDGDENEHESQSTVEAGKDYGYGELYEDYYNYDSLKNKHGWTKSTKWIPDPYKWKRKLTKWTTPKWNKKPTKWTTSKWNKKSTKWTTPKWNTKSSKWTTSKWNTKSSKWTTPKWKKKSTKWTTPIWNKKFNKWNKKATKWKIPKWYKKPMEWTFLKRNKNSAKWTIQK